MKMHLLFAFLTPLVAFASSFNIRPMSEFASTAPNIVRGTITNVHAETTLANDGGKTVFTYANLDIKENFKGQITSKAIAIRHLGGSKDGITIEIPSSPEFTDGDDTVLFLSEPTADQSYEVLGMELGKFAVIDQGGTLVLKGGLFNYTDSHETHLPESLHSENGDLSENQRTWSLNDLRSMLKKSVPASSLSTPTQASASSSPAPLNNSKDALTTPERPQPSEGARTETTEQSPQNIPFWTYPLLGLIAGGLYALKKKKK